MPLSLHRFKSPYDTDSLEIRQLLCAANMKAFAATEIPDTLKARWEDKNGLCSLVSIIVKGKQFFNPAGEVQIQCWHDHGNSHPLKLVLQQHKHAIISKG